jgi:hypothetical protein
VLAAVLAAAVPAARGQDVVDYFDPASKAPNRVERVRGAIESENPLGIRIKPTDGPAKDIPAGDVRYVRYKSAAVPELDYRRPFGLEDRALGQTKDEARRRLLGEALQGYREVLSKVKESPPAQSYFEYRIARVLAFQAEDDRTKLDDAIAAFTAYARAHTDGWEIVAALKQLARLHEDKGDLAAAGQTYAALAAVPGLTPKVRLDSDLLGVRLLLRAGRLAEAEKKLAALDAALPAGDPAKPAVQVFLAKAKLARGDDAGVEAQVKSALAAGGDYAVGAAGHNVLGDYYLKAGRPEDAFWEFLRVDVQYGEEREEAAKALYHLAQLFDKVKNDKVRAQECLARLQDKGQFGGTEYQKKASAEK